METAMLLPFNIEGIKSRLGFGHAALKGNHHVYEPFSQIGVKLLPIFRTRESVRISQPYLEDIGTAHDGRNQANGHQPRVFAYRSASPFPDVTIQRRFQISFADVLDVLA